MTERLRTVFSTERPICARCGWPADDCRCSSALRAGKEPVPPQVTAKLRLEKRASGKSVTVVDGLPDNAGFVEGLAREWKKACGTGGSAGPGTVELQGDQRERLRELLAKRGMKVKG